MLNIRIYFPNLGIGYKYGLKGHIHAFIGSKIHKKNVQIVWNGNKYTILNNKRNFYLIVLEWKSSQTKKFTSIHLTNLQEQRLYERYK